MAVRSRQLKVSGKIPSWPGNGVKKRTAAGRSNAAPIEERESERRRRRWTIGRLSKDKAAAITARIIKVYIL